MTDWVMWLVIYPSQQRYRMTSEGTKRVILKLTKAQLAKAVAQKLPFHAYLSLCRHAIP